MEHNENLLTRQEGKVGKNDGVQTFFDEICEKNKNDEEWSISSQIKF